MQNWIPKLARLVIYLYSCSSGGTFKGFILFLFPAITKGLFELIISYNVWVLAQP